MAEKKTAGAGAEAAAADAGGRKKLLIMIGAGVGVLVLGVVLGWLLLGGKGGDAGDEEAAAEEVHAPPALYVALGDKFQVVLPGEGKPHYLIVSLSALTRDPAVAEEIKFNAPLIKDRLGSLFGRQEFEALRTEEGKVALRGQVLEVVRGIVSEAMAGADGDEESEGAEKDGKPKKKSAQKAAGKGHDEAKDEPAPGGIEQVFFTEFVLQ